MRARTVRLQSQALAETVTLAPGCRRTTPEGQ